MDGFWPTFIRRTQSPAREYTELYDIPSVVFSEPSRVVVPLQDSPDDPCEVSVESGESVAEGQKIGSIGTAPEYLAVHASICGTVSAVGPEQHPLGDPVMSVTIVPEEEQTACDARPYSSYGGDFITFLRDMGVPLDYTGFQRCTHIIVNATEMEPVFSSVCRLILECGDAFADGLGFLIEHSPASGAVVLYEKKHTQIKNALNRLFAAVPTISCRAVDSPVPPTIRCLNALKHAAGKQNGKPLPLFVDPDVVVAVHRACMDGTPLTRQLVTVCGSGIRSPRNVWVPCGALLGDIVSAAGGNAASLGRVALGGPMMGLPQHRLDVPVVKMSRGIYAAVALLFDETHHSRFYQRSGCVQCGKCVDVCPAGITPNVIAELIDVRRVEETVNIGLFSCLECGLCHFVCPSMIPLTEILKLGKISLRGRSSLLSSSAYRTLLSP